jgi:hypothetical protein
MTLEGKYEYYRCMHHDFNEANKLVNHYISDIYGLPKKFVEKTELVLNCFINSSVKNENAKQESPLNPVIEFMEQLDDFTARTEKLYSQHCDYVSKSNEYMQRVSELEKKKCGRIISEYAVDYVELTPEVIKLQSGLKHLKEVADDLVTRLEKLELRWENLRYKVRA